ncbi:hypothetical protein AAMO2058_001234300 [Amorphochlora amoebiformis]
MEQLQTRAQQFIDSLDEDIQDLWLSKFAREKTGAKPAVLLIGILFLLSVLMVLTCGQAFFTNTMAFIFPVIMTISHLKSHRMDVPFWMTYWLTFNFISVVESVAIEHLTMAIPLYHLLKMLFLIWCFHNKSKGATIIYNYCLSAFVNSPQSPGSRAVNTQAEVKIPRGGQMEDENDGDVKVEDDADDGGTGEI